MCPNHESVTLASLHFVSSLYKKEDFRDSTSKLQASNSNKQQYQQNSNTLKAKKMKISMIAIITACFVSTSLAGDIDDIMNALLRRKHEQDARTVRTQAQIKASPCYTWKGQSANNRDCVQISRPARPQRRSRNRSRFNRFSRYHSH